MLMRRRKNNNSFSCQRSSYTYTNLCLVNYGYGITADPYLTINWITAFSLSIS